MTIPIPLMGSNTFIRNCLSCKVEGICYLIFSGLNYGDIIHEPKALNMDPISFHA
jgi:hypothetical protein